MRPTQCRGLQGHSLRTCHNTAQRTAHNRRERIVAADKHGAYVGWREPRKQTWVDHDKRSVLGNNSQDHGVAGDQVELLHMSRAQQYSFETFCVDAEANMTT